MAAIALLDLLRKNPNFDRQTFSSRGLFATKFVGIPATAATSFALAAPFAFGALFGNGVPAVAYCDAGMAPVGEDFGEDFISGIRTASQNIFQNDALKYTMKLYDIQLKPLFSAFHWKALAMTSLRSFLLFYLPLLETHPRPEDEDDDFLLEDSEENRLDLVTPFHKSLKQIIRESSVLTTRRILERLAVHYVSRRMAWKLLKDVPKSASRKAGRGLPTFTYFYFVERTTFRGHFLEVLASWIVQVGIDIYRFFNSLRKSREEEEGDQIDTSEQVHILGKKVYGTTVRCASSLVFASIGGGIGATLFCPSIGQWIGCAVGDLAGPIIVGFCVSRNSICSCNIFPSTRGCASYQLMTSTSLKSHYLKAPLTRS